MPDQRLMRRALNAWAFNSIARKTDPDDDVRAAIGWMRSRSIPLPSLLHAPVTRTALQTLSVLRDGTNAAPATFARKRATFHAALEYAVEMGYLDNNPLRRVKLRVKRSIDLVDRRVVVNLSQARALLAAVREVEPAMEGFFACLYFAGLRPSEARNLRVTDCTLPDQGWGRLRLSASHQMAGTAWTDSGEVSEERALKHRTTKDYREIPAHPELVETLRRHMDRFALGVGGRLFVSRTGRGRVPISPPYQNPVSPNTSYRVWHKARSLALTAEQEASPLARRPYDLRHACLSTWLNAGVPPVQVAEWAGHGVEVLLRVYAKCIDGQEALAMRRIELAFQEHQDATAEAGPEGPVDGPFAT